MNPEKIVRDFYTAMDELGFRAAFEKFLHDDIVKEDTGFGKTTGKVLTMQGLEAYLETFGRAFARIEIHNLAVNGDTVLTERTEYCENRETGDQYIGHLMSTFVIKDDRIIRWADYYDPSAYKYGKAMPRGPATRELMRMWSASHKLKQA
jgi:limonene-1,2-epoxide hydrolase